MGEGSDRLDGFKALEAAEWAKRVARSRQPELDFRWGDAEELPFENASMTPPSGDSCSITSRLGRASS